MELPDDPRPLIAQMREIAHVRGLSGPILLGLDSLSLPGKVVAHFVRLETVEMELEKCPQTLHFTPLSPRADPRVPLLVGCIKDKK